jgi:hypothetical protein
MTTSAAKIAANRLNATRSTGPQSVAGKARSSRNALRHGLAGALPLDRALGLQVEELAYEIARASSEPILREAALAAAQA